MLESRKEKSKVQKSSKPQSDRKKRRQRDSRPSLLGIVELPPGKNSSVSESNPESQGSATSGVKKDQAQSPRGDTKSPIGNHLGSGLAHLTGSFLDLNVRIFTQPLGLRSQWAERGRGYVEFGNYTIRVKTSESLKGNDNRTSSNLTGETEATASSSLLLRQTLADPQQQHPGGLGKIWQKAKKNGTLSGTNDLFDDGSILPVENMRPGSKKREDSAGQRLSNLDDLLVNSNSCIEFAQNDVDNDGANDGIILEDIITNETIFVGENCSIVWNSLDKKLSLCLMFSSVNGYIASWSALIAMQGKAYPRFELDFLSLSVRQALDDHKGSDKEAPTPHLTPINADDLYQSQCLPYSVFLHDKYNPPLGFIEKHFISLCLMQFGHIALAELYEDSSTILALLDIANEDLLGELLGDQAYPFLIKGLGCTSPPETWSIPDGLSNLTVSQELATIISKDLRSTQLLNIVRSLPVKTGFFEKLNIVVKRLRNEVIYALLSKNEIFEQIKGALEIVPPLRTSHHGGPLDCLEISDSLHSTDHDSNSTLSGRASVSFIQECQRAERQVLANLRFLRSCITLGISELGRDSVGPVVVKAFQGGMLEALSLVAVRYAMPPGAALGFLDDTPGCFHGCGSSCNADSKPVTPLPNWYSQPIDKELNSLLNATIASLNEERDEQLMNEIVRSPILEDPHKYNGIMAFMLRQLVFDQGCSPPVGGKLALYGSLKTDNCFAIFHVLGLHDNESSIAIGQPISPESTDIRHRFHRHFILNYMQHATGGSLTPVPPSPNTGFELIHATPSARSGINCELMLNLPQCISPPLIRVIDYLITLTSPENRDLVLKTILNHKSRVIQFIEKCYRIAAVSVKSQRPIGLDVLCSNTHFVKTILGYIASTQLSKEQLSFSTNDPLSQTLSTNLVIMICRRLIYETNTFGSMLKAYQKIGGGQRNTIFHSAVLSTFEIIEKGAIKAIDSNNDSMCNLQDYLFLKYFEILPRRYARRFREALLTRTSRSLGCKKTPEIADSLSGLSLTSGDILHTPSELRFVDEIEASNVKGDFPLKTAPMINRHREDDTNTPEVKFLTILRTCNEQWAPSNHFSEELKRFPGVSGPSDMFLEPTLVSPKASSGGLPMPLSVLPIQNPPSAFIDGAPLPVVGDSLGPSSKSLDTEGFFPPKPTPPATKSPANSRGRINRSISLDMVRVGEADNLHATSLLTGLVSSNNGDNAKAALAKNPIKSVQSVPVEPLTVCEDISESNTSKKTLSLSNNDSATHKKDPNLSIGTILCDKDDIVLPCLTKPKFSTF
ncbi:unnamed protein product [Phytomonas sp. EM1]|nr:unnamed protein product [Phytomonas sp. EM1]|eukprot:CCW62085.1 unnamed protein product [Phytomonas sp. isolate EM1]